MAHAPPCAPRDLSAEVPSINLKPDLEQAQLCARQRGTAVVFRFHFDLPACDPWAVYNRLAGADLPFFLWDDAGSGFCTAAWGGLFWHRLPRSAAFAQAQAHCRDLQERLWESPQKASGVQPGALGANVPAAFAAFAFNCTTAGQNAWGALSEGGVVFVPQCIVYRRDRASELPSYGVLSRSIDAETDLSTLQANLQADWRELWTAAQEAAVAFTLLARASFGGRTARGAAGADDTTDAAQAAWAARLTAAQAAMQAGLLEKVVLAREVLHAAPKGQIYDATATAVALRAQHQQAITYVMGGGDAVCFLGATPEILLRVQGRRIETQAVAGTAPRGAEPENDIALGEALMRCSKNRREHAMVADGLEADLSPLCVELQRPKEPRLIHLPRLQHLETPFAGTLRQAGGILQLCARLHPTAATGGWPRHAASAWLAAHEPLDRGLYAGPIGWMTAGGDGTFAVALRSLLLTPRLVRVYAGAGIVPGSEAAAEWQETELKLTTAQDALRLHACPDAPAYIPSAGGK